MLVHGRILFVWSYALSLRWPTGRFRFMETTTGYDKEKYAEYHLGYVLTGYKYIGKISTEEELERAKLAILDGTGYPAVAYGKTKLMSLKEFSSIDKEKAENMRKDVRKTLDQLLRLRLGLEEVELEWTCDGTIYKTVCVVSGTLGILYENVFINSFQPGVETTTVRSEF